MADEQQIKVYLQKNPDFLIRHSDLLTNLEFPKEWTEDGNLIDFRSALIENLQHQLAVRDAENHELFSIARVNHDYQQRIYDLVLQMLECNCMQDLFAMLVDDMPKQLELEKIMLCIVVEPQSTDFVQKMEFENLRQINSKMFGLLQGNHVMQRKHMKGEAKIYDTNLIHSDILIAVNINQSKGFMAFGSRAPEQFDRKLGSDFMIFLTNVFVNMMSLLNQVKQN